MRQALLHNRALTASLGVSVLFHLSMVTVFSIVIVVPPQNIQFYTFEFFRQSPREPVASAPREKLRKPSLSDASLDGTAAETASAAGGAWGASPAIELPTLEFAELHRLRVQEEGLALDERREKLLLSRSQSAWSRLGQRVSHWTTAFTRLDISSAEEGENLELPGLVPVARPAAGFEAYIEWVGEPRERELLYAPPMEGLWGVDPASLGKPIAIEFTVNPEGRVVSTWSPAPDEAGLITKAQNTLLKYRFEAVESAKPQHATLQVRAARNP